MNFLKASTTLALIATTASLTSSHVSTTSSSGLRKGRGLQSSGIFPPYNQQCRDDAGPPFQDDLPNKKYHDGKPAFAVGDCPDPLAEACQQKSKKAAFLEGPIDCDGKGWFCRILEEPGWPTVTLTTDLNFGYCNTTEGFDDEGFDQAGHCHGSDSDDAFYWWVRDHWHRGYNGRLRCCCGWDDVTSGAIVNSCDYRRLVTQEENLEDCRDANEEGVTPYRAGCSSENSPTIGQPIPEDDAKCWEVQKFGEPDDENQNQNENENDNEDEDEDEDEDDDEDEDEDKEDEDEDNQDNEDCVDDKSFRFKGDDQKSCKWIGKTDKRAEKYCPKKSEGEKVSEACPVACDACSGEDEDEDEQEQEEDDCADDKSFRFKGDDQKNCKWIGKKNKRVEKYCPKKSEGEKVSEACPVACDAC